MTRKRIALSLFALLALGVAVFASSGSGAGSYRPQNRYSVANPAAGAISDTSLYLTIPAPDHNYEDSSMYTFAPIDGWIAPGNMIPIGAGMGQLSSLSTLGFFNTACDAQVVPNFNLYNATVDTSNVLGPSEMNWTNRWRPVPYRYQCSNSTDDDADTKINDGCPIAINYAENDPANPCDRPGATAQCGTAAACTETSCADADGYPNPWDNCDDDADGYINDGCAPVGAKAELASNIDLPDYLEHYPYFLNDMLDPDGPCNPTATGDPLVCDPADPGSKPPLQPRARYAGHTQVAGTSTLIQIIVLNPGQITQLPGIKAQMVSGLGYVVLTVLNNPSSQQEAPAPISDFCTPLSGTTTLYGVTKDNPEVAWVNDGCPAKDTAESDAQCDNALDDDGDTNVNDGCPAVGAPEDPSCVNADDDDSDGYVNDGCPKKGNIAENAQVIDGGVDVNGDTVVNASDDLAALAGKQIIDGRVDVSGNGTIGTEDDGTWAGTTVIDGGVDINGDTVVNASDDGFLDALCASNLDDDGDTRVNDGCAKRGANPENPACANDIDDDLATGDEAGYTAQRNPLANTGVLGTGTHMTRTYSQSERDADGDGIENDMDPCPYTADPLWNPRSGPEDLYWAQCDNALDDDGDGWVNEGCPAVNLPETGVQCADDVDANEDGAPDKVNDGCPEPGDLDSDGLPNSCDPDPQGAAPEPDPIPGTNCAGPQNDCDNDGYLNRQDICPLVANGCKDSACGFPFNPIWDNQSDEDSKVLNADLGPGPDSIGDACDDSDDDGNEDSAGVGTCNDGIDNGGDTLVDGNDPDCIPKMDKAELGQCRNSTDDDPVDDGTPYGTWINDGCPARGAAETDCGPNEALPLDDDADTRVNDGCPTRGASPEAAGTTNDFDIWGTNPGTGLYFHAMPWSAMCIGATDTDKDGYCDALECVGTYPACTSGLGSDPNNGSEEELVTVTCGGANPSCCDNDDDDDDDGYVNDGCPMVGDYIESGAQCTNDVSDDTPIPDGQEQAEGATVNDGCPVIGVPESLVIDATITAPAALPSAIPPQSCTDGVDNDNDTDIDGDDDDAQGCDTTTYGTDTDYDGANPDNCPGVWNPEQTNTDVVVNPPGDAPGDACDTDDDNDGWPDNGAAIPCGFFFTCAAESYLGTDPLNDCPQVLGNHDAWPLDMNMDRILNLTKDVAKFTGKIACSVPQNFACRRLDLNGDGVINLTKDVAQYPGKIGVVSCTP